MSKKLIRIIQCCDSYSWDYFDPDQKKINNSIGNLYALLKAVRIKKEMDAVIQNT